MKRKIKKIIHALMTWAAIIGVVAIMALVVLGPLWIVIKIIVDFGWGGVKCVSAFALAFCLCRGIGWCIEKLYDWSKTEEPTQPKAKE